MRKYLFFLLNLLGISAVAQKIPSSERSRVAVARVMPALQQELSRGGFRWGSPLFIRIIKEKGVLECWLRKGNQFARFKTYPICHFSGELGPKTKQGDNQAPEGFYEVRPAQMNPNSSYHLSFNLGYPNAYDRAHGYTGSALMVHGNCVSIGCYAMTDGKIEEIYTLMQAAFEGGQKVVQVHCFPFEMITENLSKYADNKRFAFWQNLAVGYQLFEQNLTPPRVDVRSRKYVFE
ncbi:MAG: murein L,D-transpeptidase [Spirosomaceae bacterium]|jgi:murein L,D-transpeptidase YafK|nr:murein L,D-transpeptidase [Spirosomataceae bacterium]